jgi:hypothetical protein
MEIPMSDYPKTFDHMLAAWNEREPAKVRGHLEQALHPEVHFVDPSNDITGVDAFEAMVHEFRAKFPDAVCSRASGVDGHHRLYRYEWAIHRGDTLLIPGFDVVEADEAGRVTRVLGFFGPLPSQDG